MCLLESFAKNAECHPHLNEPVVARIIDQIKVAYWNAGRALTLGTTSDPVRVLDTEQRIVDVNHRACHSLDGSCQ